MALDKARFRSRSGFSRREALKSLCGGVGMLGLADLLKGDAFAAGAHTVGPHFAPKAKNVIMLFMTGGPSQVDLWDPKPALMKYAGQRPKTADLRTERTTAGLLPSRFEFARHGKAGIEMSELLPNLATVADELCVIRSMYTTNPNHEQAWCMFHQGSMILSRPSVGSSLSWGAEHFAAPQLRNDLGVPAGRVRWHVAQHVRDRARQDDPLPAEQRA